MFAANFLSPLFYQMCLCVLTRLCDLPSPYRNIAKHLFFKNIGEAFEQDLLNPSDEFTIRLLVNTVEECDDKIVRQMALQICGFAKTKKKCGIILKHFCDEMNSSESLDFIYSIISRDFFMDLRGKLDDFIEAIPDMSHAIRRLIHKNFNLNSKGEIVESDEDENGNLKGFIVDEEEESHSGISEDYLDDERSGGSRKMKSKRRGVICDDDDDDDDDDNEDDYQREEDTGPDCLEDERLQIEELNRIAAEKRKKKKHKKNESK